MVYFENRKTQRGRESGKNSVKANEKGNKDKSGETKVGQLLIKN